MDLRTDNTDQYNDILAATVLFLSSTGERLQLIRSTAQKEQIHKLQRVHQYNGMSRSKASIALLKTALQEKRLASQNLFVILGVTLACARVLFVGIALQRTHIHSPRNTYLGRLL